jgi:hypothetical protein
MTIRFCKLAILFLTIFFSGCAGVRQKMHESIYQSLESIEDSIRGYRVVHVTFPAGAQIVCNGKEVGLSPYTTYHDLSDTNKASGVFELRNCEAIWKSGARAAIDVEIPLAAYPKFAYVSTERPEDADGFEVDRVAGDQLLADRARAIAKLQSMVGQAVDLGIAVYDARKYSNASPGHGVMPSSTPFARTGSDGIRWNWVHSSVSSTSWLDGPVGLNRQSMKMEQVFEATSCVGSVLMGRCEGTIRTTQPPRYCVGGMVGGRCAGPVIFSR